MDCRDPLGDKLEPLLPGHPWDPPAPCPNPYCHDGRLERAACVECGEWYDHDELRQIGREVFCRVCAVILLGVCLDTPVPFGTETIDLSEGVERWRARRSAS